MTHKLSSGDFDIELETPSNLTGDSVLRAWISGMPQTSHVVRVTGHGPFVLYFDPVDVPGGFGGRWWRSVVPSLSSEWLLVWSLAVYRSWELSQEIERLRTKK